jgi:hypothetical protein
MIFRRRAPAAIAALAALLVSWTAGPGAALCMPGATEEAAKAAAHLHGHAAALHGHAAHAVAVHAAALHGHMGHGGMHHGAPAPETQPLPPADEPGRPDAPECPLMVMNSGSCLGAATAPALVKSTLADLPPADDYPPPAAVRDQLLSASLFRPPEA